MTCSSMGGACDAEITGNTPEEMMENGKKHIHEATDEAHGELIEKMKGMSEEDMNEWKKEFNEKFEAAPDA